MKDANGGEIIGSVLLIALYVVFPLYLLNWSANFKKEVFTTYGSTMIEDMEYRDGHHEKTTLYACGTIDGEVSYSINPNRRCGDYQSKYWYEEDLQNAIKEQKSSTWTQLW